MNKLTPIKSININIAPSLKLTDFSAKIGPLKKQLKKALLLNQHKENPNDWTANLTIDNGSSYIYMYIYLWFQNFFNILKWCQRLTPLSRDEFWRLKMVNFWPFSKIFWTFNTSLTLLNESRLQNWNTANRFFVNRDLSLYSGVSETVKYMGSY